MHVGLKVVASTSDAEELLVVVGSLAGDLQQPLREDECFLSYFGLALRSKQWKQRARCASEPADGMGISNGGDIEKRRRRNHRWTPRTVDMSAKLSVTDVSVELQTLRAKLSANIDSDSDHAAYRSGARRPRQSRDARNETGLRKVGAVKAARSSSSKNRRGVRQHVRSLRRLRSFTHGKPGSALPVLENGIRRPWLAPIKQHGETQSAALSRRPLSTWCGGYASGRSAPRVWGSIC